MASAVTVIPAGTEVLRAGLETIASLAPQRSADVGQARREARRILSEPPFTPRRPPRPFAGILRRLGEWFVEPVQRFFERLGDALPGAGSGVWLLVAVPVVLASAIVALRLIRDRSRVRRSPRGALELERSDDPDALDRGAEEAEEAGDLAAALRLRFRAGLLRLDRAGALELRPGLTNAAARRALRSRRFDGLAHRFDEVAYGGRAATSDDLTEARHEWPGVLTEAASR